MGGESMKCPNCGAEIGVNKKFCEACGSQISYDMRREQEQVNKQGCPQCGSSNIQFRRENQGEIRGKKSKQVVHRTVGFCKDCGYTWYPSGANSVPQKNNLVWWILGWIFFFPAPVMVLIWRKKNTWDIKIKIAVTVVFWLFILIIGSTGNKDKTTDSSSTDSSIAVESSIDTESDKTSDNLTQNELVEDEGNKYADDDIVNQFITDYNAISQYEMTDIEKGNIRTKYFGHTNNCYVEMINATDATAEAFCVTVNGGNNEEITESMFAVFPEVVHTLDSTITDEQIQQAIADFKDGNVMNEGYKLGDSLTITYIPLVFKDDGSYLASSRLDISSSTYGK